MANPWAKLVSLLPKTPIGYGQCTAHNADESSTITLPDGGTLRVFGQSVAVGQYCYFQDGRIRSEASAMATYTVTV
jgi:hypothetical protein